MKEKQAVQLFHGPERYNCAQAVLAAFQTESGLPDCALRAAAGSGGGRATDGFCGALHGVRVLVDGEEQFQVVEREFTAVAGSPRCMEIRSRRTLSCSGCVALAAQLLEQALGELRRGDPVYISGLEDRIQALLPVQGVSECASRRRPHLETPAAVGLNA